MLLNLNSLKRAVRVAIIGPESEVGVCKKLEKEEQAGQAEAKLNKIKSKTRANKRKKESLRIFGRCLITPFMV